MRAEDRVRAVVEFGFTPRQARFLVVVMRYAGICLLRQYSTFAGIVQEQKTRAFFRKLVDRGFASSYACRHNRGRLYHVHHVALYRAIEEPNSAYRRPVTAARVAERLMILDAILMNPLDRDARAVIERPIGASLGDHRRYRRSAPCAGARSPR